MIITEFYETLIKKIPNSLAMITFAKLHDNKNAFHLSDIVTVFSLSQLPVTVASFGT